MPFTYTCARCSKEVVRETRGKGARVFCSNECYHLATRVHLERECPGCGIVFRPGKYENKLKAYCSQACWLASSKVTKRCPGCGRDFQVNLSVEHRFTYCSRECRYPSTVFIDCERCGTPFRAEKPLTRTRRFCSEECRRPPVHVTCKTCGTEFRTQPSAASGTRQFCSRSCYRKHTGETMLEFRIRQALSMLHIDFIQELDVNRWTIDFALTSLAVALEADGDYWHQLTAERDARRDVGLAALGWHVIRLPEQEVNNASDLCGLIVKRLQEVPGLEIPSLTPAVGSHERVIVSRRDRPVFRLNYRKTARVRTRHSGPNGTLPLWGDD